MDDVYDIVIIGGGPAGSSCALRAAELGLSAIVLERDRFPRDKPCGGGLTPRAMELMGGSFGDVAGERIGVVRVRLGRSLSMVWSSGERGMASVCRDRFDAALLARAEEAGASVVHGVSVRHVAETTDGAAASSAEGSWSGRCLVGADGVRGNTRSSLGFAPSQLAGGVCVKIEAPAAERPDGAWGGMLFDLSACAGGYGWVFPKEGHLNAGLYCTRGLSGELVSALDGFLESCGLSGRRLDGPFAYPVPRVAAGAAVARGRVMLAGDAAGLADAVTGEGIRHAMASGRLAAEAAAAAIASGAEQEAGAVYSELVRREMLPGLLKQKRAGSLFYSIGPRAFTSALRFAPLRKLIAGAGPWGEYGIGGGALDVRRT